MTGKNNRTVKATQSKAAADTLCTVNICLLHFLYTVKKLSSDILALK